MSLINKKIRLNVTGQIKLIRLLSFVSGYQPSTNNFILLNLTSYVLINTTRHYMANNKQTDETSSSYTPIKDNLDRDTLLCNQYDEYLIQVRESGVPLWLIEYYSYV